MRKLIAEYGIVLLVAMVIIVLLGILAPITNVVKDETIDTFTDFGERIKLTLKKFPSKNYGVVDEKDFYLEVGGRIFYDSGANNGATYYFYNENKERIYNLNITDYKNAYYYSIEGEPSFPRFYAYATDENQSEYTGNILVSGQREWGGSGNSVGITEKTIGEGKGNTDKILSIAAPLEDSKGRNETPWEWIKILNKNNYNNHNDWFIGSISEIEKLKSSKLTNIFDKADVCSSSQNNTTSAFQWNRENGYSISNDKKSKAEAVAMRGF